MQREGAVDLARALLNSDGLSGTQAQKMKVELVATSHLDQQSAEVATQPGYQGYRAGMRIVGGSWKFTYFVPAENAL